MAKISNLSKFFGLVRVGETEANPPLNVRALATKQNQRRPSRINSKLAIALAGLVAVAGINNQLVSVAHADDATPTNNNNNDAGGGGVLAVGNGDPVFVQGFIPPSVYPTQVTLGPGAGYGGQVIGAVGIGPSGGGSIHTPNNKTRTNKKTQNANPCPDNQGDPIMMSTGNKAVSSTEFSLPGEMGLTFERFYNSKLLASETNLGTWTDSIDFLISGTNCAWTGQQGNPGHCSSITFIRPDGSELVFPTTNPSPLPNGLDTVNSFPNAGPFTSVGTATLIYNANGTYTVQDEDSHALNFNASGQLLSIKDLAGVGWTITHPNSTTILVTHTSGQSYSIVQTPGSGNNEQVQVTDPAGNIYTYQSANIDPSLSSIGLINSVTYPGSPTTTVSYKYQDAPGNSVANELTEVDYNGVAHDLTTYDSNGNASGTSMADGSQKTSIVYSSNSTGQVATVTNALGHVTVYQYNSNGLLVSITGDASAHCSASYGSVTYDANGNMASSTDNNGNVTNYTYASNGLLQQTVESPGAYQRVTNYAWDSTPGTDRLLSVTVVGYLETSFTYNAQGRLATSTVTNLTGNGVANQSQTTTYSYTLSSNGMVSSETVTLPSPSNANTVTYNYSSFGFITSVANALGQTTSYSNLTGVGLPQTVTSPNGDVTNFTYNAGRLVSTTHTHAGETNTGYVYYDANSRQVSEVVLFDNEITKYNYDQDFKLASSTWTGPSGAVITKNYTYDANGDNTSVSWTRQGASAPDLVTNTSYDELGRPIVVSGNHGQTTTTTYDPNGNISTVTDTAGNVTTHKYDSMNRLQYLIDATGKSTQYSYDFGNKPLQVIDPRGLATSYKYDGFGDLWSLNSPDTGSTSFSNDAYGRAASKTTNDGVVTSYAYDTLNRVTSVSAGGKSLTYTYDSCTYGKGHLCGFSDATGSTAYTYAIEGTVASRSWTNFLGTGTTSYFYDGMNRLLQISEGGVYIVTYTWTDDQISTVNFKSGSINTNVVSGVTYDAVKHATGWTYGNGVQRSETFDNDGRITGIHSAMGTSSVQSLSYVWDDLNRITAINNAQYSVVTQDFTYDTLNRLTNMTGPAPIALTYDASGNRTEQNWKTNDAVSIAGSSNQMLARGSHTYTYTANGNRATDTTSGVTTTYSYDPFNYLSSVSRPAAVSVCETNGNCPTYPAGTVSYVSNAIGQRMWQNGPAGFQLYGYGLNGELTGDTFVPASGTTTNNYFVYLNGKAVAVFNDQATLYYIHNDHLGRPEELTNGSGATVWLGLNYAFDRSILVQGLNNIDIGLSGQVYDSNTGNWSNGFRDYDSSDGRYLESDPLGLAGGVNTYAYVGGNPLSRIDPYGLAWGYSFNIGFTVITPWVGVSANIGAGFTIDGFNSVGYDQGQLNISNEGDNHGIFVGAGPAANVSNAEPPTTGLSQSPYIEGDAGGVLGLGVSAMKNSCGGIDWNASHGPKGGFGVGLGGFAGTSYSATVVGPTLGTVLGYLGLH